MDDINKVYTIQWVGPFDTFDNLKTYLENPDTCDKTLFSFYFCSGSKKGKGFPVQRDSYRYFGLHKADTAINSRVRATHEKLRLFREPFSLWIGSISNSNMQNPQNIEDIETLFISTYRDILTENERKKKSKPSESICVINLWYKPNEDRWVNKKKEIKIFDDVLVYEMDIDKYSIGTLSLLYK